LRRPIKSLAAAEKIFIAEVVASAIPSIKPTAVVLAPSTVTKNTGRSA
jgi:hypothetical protein